MAHTFRGTKMSLTGTVAVAIATYAGKLVTDLEGQADPEGQGCFGFKAILDDGAEVHFLTHGVPLQKVTRDHLEEVVSDFSQ